MAAFRLAGLDRRASSPQRGIYDDIVGAKGNTPAAGEACRTVSEGNLLFALHRTHNCIRKVTPSGELFAWHKSFEIGIDT
jgi:hypothetical protein